MRAATDPAEAAALFAETGPMRAVYQRWIREPLRQGHAPCAALKQWCARMGLAAGPVRRPLRPLPPEQARALDAAPNAAGVSPRG